MNPRECLSSVIHQRLGFCIVEKGHSSAPEDDILDAIGHLVFDDEVNFSFGDESVLIEYFNVALEDAFGKSSIDRVQMIH